MHSGWGITRVLSYQVLDELAAAQLQILLEEFELERLIAGNIQDIRLAKIYSATAAEATAGRDCAMVERITFKILRYLSISFSLTLACLPVATCI